MPSAKTMGVPCALLPQRGVQRKCPLRVDRCPVREHAQLRQRGDLARELLRGGQRLAGPDHAAGQPHCQGLVGVDRAAGEDHVQRPPHADDARQAHGAAVDQRHAPAAAEHAEHGIVLHHPQVGQQGQFEAPGDGVSADRGNQRFGQGHPGRPHRAGCAAVGHERVAARGIADGGQIGAGAEMAARAAQHRHAQRVIGGKALEGIEQRGGSRPVDGVAARRAVEQDCADRAIGLEQHGCVGHGRSPRRGDPPDATPAAAKPASRPGDGARRAACAAPRP